MTTKAPAITLSFYCKFCKRFKLRSQINRINERQGNFCDDCYYQYLVFALLDFARGGVPPGCYECGRPREEIARQAIAEGAFDGDEVVMYLHPKDGIMQPLCKPCSDRYAAASGVYHGTQFEHDAKLKGYK